MTIEQAYSWLDKMDNHSIYAGRRLAQPDEVANYRTGDGLEKAFLLANVIRTKEPEQGVEIIASGNEVIVKSSEQYRFVSAKDFRKRVNISKTGEINVE
jgi:hypothetical protein